MRLQTGKSCGDVGLQKAVLHEATLQVDCSEGLPTQVVWKNRRFRVTSVTPVACVQSKWWLYWQSGGIVRRTFRVELQDTHGQRLHAEIVHQNSVWKLSKILD